MAGDVLVRGGTVVDGTGSPGVPADVRVKDGVIVEVGPGLRPDGEREVDAGGALVTPGFVDPHTHYDGSVWWDGSVDPAPLHGVTTVLTGNCAISLAPAAPEHRESVADMFCFIEDIPLDAVLEAVPWTWGSWADHKRAFDERGAACHVAPLVGHNNLRLAVLGEESFERAATEDERRRITQLTVECLQEGAFGVSLSFVDGDRSGRRVPSRLASPQELSDLAEAMATVGHGVVEYVPRFMKLDGYLKDIDRVDAACRPFGIPHTYAPLPAGRRARQMADAILEHTRAVNAAGGDVRPQVSPRSGFDTRFVFDGASLNFAAMRSWADMCMAKADEKRRMLADPAWRDAARHEWDTAGFTIFPRHAVRNLLIPEVAQPALKAFEGAHFGAVIDARDGHPSDVLAQWILDTDLEPALVIPGTADEDRDYLGSLLAQEDVLLGASDAGAHVLMLCGAGDTTLFLQRYVRERGDLTIEQAVRKLTSQPAAAIGLRDRGVVAAGYAGDLVVFALDELSYERERLVADLPGGSKRFTRPSGGYRATIAAGVPTQEGGTSTGAQPGRMLDARVTPR